MIVASELRQGNIIETVDGIRQVTGVLGEVIYWGGEMEFCASFRCEPVPLTEEWLLKLGFSRSPLPFSEGVYEGPIIDNRVEYNAGSFMYCLWTQRLRNIEHVHQLQNLYYALTGEELKIK